MASLPHSCARFTTFSQLSSVNVISTLTSLYNPSSATLNPHKPIPISASAATPFLHWTSLYVSTSWYYPVGQPVYAHVGRPSCIFNPHHSCDIDFQLGRLIHPRQPVKKKHYHNLHIVRLPHSAHAPSSTLCTWSKPNLAATV